MSELAVSLLRLSFLLILWVFVVVAISVLRRDLYGTTITRRKTAGYSGPARRSGLAAAPTAIPQPGPPPTSPHLHPYIPTQPALASPPSPDQTPTYVIVTAGPLAGTSLPLSGNGILIGRSAASNLVLDDEYTSGRHAHIGSRDDAWYLEDLGSTNGTFLGRVRVTEPTALAVGQIIRIGQTTIETRR